jgi:peptide/nickel transport system substrate-binding protein
MQASRVVVLTSVAVLVVGCTSAGPAAPASPASQTGTPSGTRVLTMSIPREPTFIAALAPLPSQQASDFYVRAFNAFLDLYDDQGHPVPYMAEALPALNTDSWVVFPDGRMETRYHLKPNLLWHDGVPLTADDFVFTFQVWAPLNGFRTAVVPYTLIDDVIAQDDRTLVLRWKSLYPDAAVLLGAARFGLSPLPRRILEPAYNQGLEAFQNSSYWGHDFVGSGPYKLDRWELGSSLEGVAFDQHVLGRPKIDRIRMLFITDPNTAFANLLAGGTQMALDSINFAQMLQLQQEWGGSNQGTANLTVGSFNATYIQHRPEYANPKAILDVRVHQALAYGIDKKTLADTLWSGKLDPLDTIFDTTADYYSVIDRAITKYPHDPRTSERLMVEAGYTRGADGVFASPTEGKLNLVLQAPNIRPEPPILAANWRQAGFDIEEQPLSATQILDPQVRATFPTFYINAASLAEVQQTAVYRGSEVMTADRGWRGENVTGWKNDQFDRLVDLFYATLDQNERIQQRAQMARILSDELPSIMLTGNPNMHAFLSSVKNVSPTTPPLTIGRITWNIERWELQ